MNFATFLTFFTSPWRVRWAWAGLVVASSGLFFLCVRLIFLCLPVVSEHGEAQLESRPPILITTPWSQEMAKTSFTVTLPVRNARLGVGRIRIIPDDCVVSLRYGGHRVTIPPNTATCDIEKGFAVDLPDLDGERDLGIRIRNDMGPGAIDVVPELNLPGYVSLFGAVASFLFLVRLITTALGWDRGFRYAMLIGILARVLYTIPTGWRVRAMDTSHHYEYIQMLLAHHTIPGQQSCFECYHPPFYYIVAAVVNQLVLGVPLHPQRCLQFFSLFWAIVYLFAGLAAVRRLTEGTRYQWLSAFVFALWPAAILHTPHINNDVMVQAFAACTVYAVIAYWQAPSLRWIAAASAFGTLALLSKYNGLFPLAAIPVVAFAHFWLERRGPKWKTAILHPLISGALVVASISTSLLLSYIRVRATKQGGLYYSNSDNGLEPSLEVGSAPYNYLWFDLRTWFQHAFTDSRDDARGRQLFWNFLGKSSLFGEFSITDRPLWVWIAGLMSALVLVIVVLTLRALFRAGRRDIPWVVLMGLYLAGGVSLRLYASYSCSGDFRYILPVTILIAAAVARALEDWTSRTHLKRLVIACVCAFSALSFVFYSTILFL